MKTRQKGLQSNSDPMCFLFLFADIAGNDTAKRLKQKKYVATVLSC